MKPEEALEILEEVKQLDDTLYAYSSVYMEALEVALFALKEIQNYRKLGTLEELARAKKYIDLAKKHGTIGEMIDECAEYEAIGTIEQVRNQKANLNTAYKIISDYEACGTVEQCRETLEKSKPKPPKDNLKINPIIDDNGAYVDADIIVYLHCPNCGEMVGIDENIDKFCCECGQAIDTENLEGMEDGT